MKTWFGLLSTLFCCGAAMASGVDAGRQLSIRRPITGSGAPKLLE